MLVSQKIPSMSRGCVRQTCAKLNPQPKLAINVPIIWVLGGPGAGKGTQCKKIVEKYKFVHLSTGDLLRQEVARQTRMGHEVQAIMDRGDLVPNEMVLELLKSAISEALSQAKGFLIDGYPREKNQGMMFEEKVAPVDCILFFETSDETMISRLKNRAKESAREDDQKEEVMKTRIDNFKAEKDLILQQYKDKLKIINAERTEDEVFVDVESNISPLLPGTPSAAVQQ